MKQISIPLPCGKRMFIALADEVRDAARHTSGLVFGSNLTIDKYRRGVWQGRQDLGSVLVTNVGVLALANEGINLAGVSAAPVNLFKLLKYHSTGTGATAAATTDIKLGTPFTANSVPVVAGSQVLVPAANLQKYQTVATMSYDTGTGNPTSIKEWGLFTGATLSSATGSPFTAGDATSGTDTGSAQTASSSTAQGMQQHIAENTGNATPHWGLIQTNTTHIFTVPAWYKVSDGTDAGTYPANGNAFVVRPVMWDRKVFSTDVSDGDSIQFTYTLTCSSGG